LVVFVALACAAPPGAAAALRLAPGDLLVLDATHQKILRVDPDTGGVADFAPRGGHPDLIADPRGIASSPEGQVYVTNYGGASLVRIDAASGAQQIVEFSSGGVFGPLDIGTHPAGVAVSPAPPGPGGVRDVYVSSQGALHRVEQGLFDTTSTSTPYPPGYEASEGLFLVVYPSGVVQGYVAAGQDVLRFDGGSLSRIAGTIGTIQGIAWAENRPLITHRPVACPSASNGVQQIVYSQQLFGFVAEDYAVGGDVACPGALVATPGDTLPLYVIDEGSSPQRIVRVDSAGAPGTTAIVATLPSAATYPALAVYVPEPEPAAGAEVAVAATATFAAACRRGRRGA